MCALLAVDPVSVDQLTVRWRGVAYPASPVADGAAFELLASQPAPGWLPHAGEGYRRYVHATEIDGLSGPAPTPPDRQLMVPLRRSLTPDTVHRLSQRGTTTPDETAVLRAVRESAAIRCGTRMVKPIRPEQVAAYLSGAALIRGFCYRRYDVAHLRSPQQLAVLGVAESTADVCFSLRWRATDAADYEVPWGDAYRGLLEMPASQRVGPPVLGGGFAYSNDHLIPEYVTAGFADLPLPLHTEIVAHLEDGAEVPLFRYLAEHMWSRVANRRLDHLVARIPGIAASQQFHPIRATPATRLVSRHRGTEVEVDADPPVEFRARAASRADRVPVDNLARRVVRCASHTGDEFTVVGAEQGYLRVRACDPGPEAAFAYDLRCLERGVYEAWLPTAEAVDVRQTDLTYWTQRTGGGPVTA